MAQLDAKWSSHPSQRKLDRADQFFQQSMPPSPSGDWWQRPLGIVGLSIIGGYVVAILAKFTGMV